MQRDRFISRIEQTVAKSAQKPKLCSLKATLSRAIEPDRLFDYDLWPLVKSLLRASRRAEYEGVVSFADSIGFTQKHYSPEQIKTALDRFACEGESEELGIFRTQNGTWRKSFTEAGEELKKMLLHQVGSKGLHSLPIRNDEDVKEVLDHWDTSAGWIGYVEPGESTKKVDHRKGIADRLKEELPRVREEGTFGTPWIAFHRSQTGIPYSDDYSRKVVENMVYKSRAVVCNSLHHTVCEARTAKPVQAMMARVPFYVGGKTPDQLETAIKALNRHKRFWTSIDFSHFDQSIQGWLIAYVFSILRELFHSDPEFDEGLWKAVVHDFIVKAIYGPEGRIWYAKNGVPSGSMYTQIMDTLCNWLMIQSYLKARGIQAEMLIMGDDNLIFSNEEIDLSDMEGYLRHVYGMTMHPHKCKKGTSANHPDFLSRVWTPHGVYRHPYKILLRMMYPERKRLYSKGSRPEDVLYAYFLAFPLGIKELCDPDLFRAWLIRYLDKDRSVDPRFAPGIVRYRLLYQRSVMTQREFDEWMAMALKAA